MNSSPQRLRFYAIVGAVGCAVACVGELVVAFFQFWSRQAAVAAGSDTTLPTLSLVMSGMMLVVLVGVFWGMRKASRRHSSTLVNTPSIRPS